MPTGVPGPEGWSVFIPTGPAPSYKDFMGTDEFFKSDIEGIDADEVKAAKRLEEDWGFGERSYALELAAAQNSGPVGDYGVAAAQASAALAKEKAAHDNANRAEYLREWLGSRGMIDSGQNAWEQNERTYQFDIYNKGIDQDLAARVQAANDSRAAAQAALSNRLAQLTLGHDKDVLQHSRDVEDLPGFYAKQRGTAAFNLWSRLNESGQLNAPGINGAWDEESQLYVTADGRYWAVGPDKKPYEVKWTKPGTTNTDGSGDVPTTQNGVQYQEWNPAENQLPGGWGYM